MKPRIILSICSVSVLLIASIAAMPAQAEVGEFKFFGDFRGRFESDARTKKQDGEYVDQERNRFRYRFRVGGTYQAHEYVELGARLASGDTRDANSPHVVIGSDANRDNNEPKFDDEGNKTNDGNYGFSRDPLTIDKAYVKGKYAGGFVWFGRNSMPLWQPNEYFWDSDVIPEGMAAGYTLKDVGPLTITLQAGNFVIQEGGWSEGAPNAHMETLQGVVIAGLDVTEITAAYGTVSTDGGAQIRSQNPTFTKFARYNVINLLAKINAIEDVGISVGISVMESDADKDESGMVTELGVSLVF